MTPTERNVRLNVESRTINQALADVIVLTERRDWLGKPATPTEAQLAHRREKEIRAKLEVANKALVNFWEASNA